MLTINGTLVQCLPTMEGESERGHWVRGGFVIEYGDEFVRKAAFTCFGEEKVATVQAIAPNTPVQVKFSPKSREFNERWYTDLECVSVTPLGQRPADATRQPAQPAAQMPSGEDSDLPF